MQVHQYWKDNRIKVKLILLSHMHDHKQGPNLGKKVLMNS